MQEKNIKETEIVNMDFKQDVEIEKRYICKNAICKYNGSSSERMKEFLVRRQYPKGSTFVLAEDLIDLGDSIEKDFEASGFKRVKGKFPKFDSPLFSFDDENEKTNENMEEVSGIVLKKKRK